MPDIFSGAGHGTVLEQGLSKAETSIEVLNYLFLAPRRTFNSFSKTSILPTLARKAKQGVNITMISNDRFPTAWMRGRIIEERKRLRSLGITVLTFPKNVILHSKLVIIDRKIAFTGSMNLTADSLNKNHEILIRFDEKEIIIEFVKAFFEAYTHSKGN